MTRLEQIQQNRQKLTQLGRQFHAHKLYLFGSCARKEEHPDSDVDILADFSPEATLFDQAGLKLALEEVLSCQVDVIPCSALNSPDFGRSVRQDMLAI